MVTQNDIRCQDMLYTSMYEDTQTIWMLLSRSIKHARQTLLSYPPGN